MITWIRIVVDGTTVAMLQLLKGSLMQLWDASLVLRQFICLCCIS